MARHIPHATEDEYWSDLDQGLHRKSDAKSESDENERHEREEHARLADPADYSAIGGPESERSYGRTRSDAGEYPFGPHLGAADRDPYGKPERGGYLKLRGLNR